MGFIRKIAGAAAAFAAGFAAGKAAGSKNERRFGLCDACCPEDCEGCGGCDLRDGDPYDEDFWDDDLFGDETPDMDSEIDEDAAEALADDYSDECGDGNPSDEIPAEGQDEPDHLD